jgi:bifunctional non-homologous end joining protein LigD
VTSEPSGTAPPPSDGRRFVVQRHRASRLHYDLRLEVDGVLASWAVPKGPTLDPGVKRMAVHVEDHPLDYFDFEGVIPAGEYGGGDVIVWDWGTWALAEGDDALAAIEAGDVHFDLDGEKLHGRFVLVQRDSGGRDRQWLLLKKRDEAAQPGWDPEEHPRSVRSGRTNDEVAAAPAATWSSHASWLAPTDAELAALDQLHADGRWTIGGQQVTLTDLGDTIIPGRRSSGEVTKRDLVRHLTSMAPAVLPYLHDRTVELHRFPAGIDDEGSWQRTLPASAPAWLTRHSVGSRSLLVVDSPAALAWVAGRSTLELAASTSATTAADRPTWVRLVVEPDGDGDLEAVLAPARLTHTALDHLGLDGRPLLAGASLEVLIPIAPRSTADAVHAWVEQLAGAIAAIIPDAPPPRAADARSFRVPFSVLPQPGGPVVVPLAWDELDDPDLRVGRWTVADAGTRLATVGDPLAPLIGKEQRLPRL